MCKARSRSVRIVGPLFLTALWLVGCASDQSARVSDGATGSQSYQRGASEQSPEEFFRSRQAEALVGDLVRQAELDRAHAMPELSYETVATGSSPAQTNIAPSYDVTDTLGEPDSGADARAVQSSMRLSSGEVHALEAGRAPEEIESEVVAELASLLRARADEPDWPVPSLIRLAALDLLEPGVFNSYYLAAAGGGSMSALHPRDIETLGAWRELFRRTRESLASEGEGADLAAIAQEFADALGGQQSLRIPRAMLCSRVDGFGLYKSFPSPDGRYKLLVGRRHRLIVYTELERFAHRATSEDGEAGYAVELTQDLALYHAGGQRHTLAWRKPNQEIYDFSRNRRRDFFIVQIINLPETLTVGAYDLKIRVLDEGSEPSSQAEHILSIDMVADASALAGD